MSRYVVVRFSPSEVMPLTGIHVPGWESTGGGIFRTRDEAVEHARKYAGKARIYELVPIPLCTCRVHPDAQPDDFDHGPDCPYPKNKERS